ncbi:MAG: hypothetical protein NTW07_04090 [candidate division Zixibacteria bacterium]|nr:hypothetical protein [candidate division Zixibacteria bacterium]
MKRLFITSLVLLVTVGSLSAQQSDVASLKDSKASSITGLGISPASTPFSLLDLSRVRWSNSYSVAFFSGGGSSGSIGLWNTGLDYDISSKLHLALNLGVLHNPGALWGRSEAQASFLPGFRLDFRPSDKVMMSLSVQQVAGYYSPYDSRSYYRGVGPYLTE